MPCLSRNNRIVTIRRRDQYVVLSDRETAFFLKISLGASPDPPTTAYRLRFLRSASSMRLIRSSIRSFIADICSRPWRSV